MKFTIEQAEAVRTAYVDNVSDTDRHNTLDQDLHDALNTVFADLPVAPATQVGDLLAREEREYVEHLRKGPQGARHPTVALADRLAPRPAPKTPGQVAFEANPDRVCEWRELTVERQESWESIAKAVLAHGAGTTRPGGGVAGPVVDHGPRPRGGVAGRSRSPGGCRMTTKWREYAPGHYDLSLFRTFTAEVDARGAWSASSWSSGLYGPHWYVHGEAGSLAAAQAAAVAAIRNRCQAILAELGDL